MTALMIVGGLILVALVGKIFLDYQEIRREEILADAIISLESRISSLEEVEK